jgi:pimeloyl-ACP methyl ester carboxylesterase
MHELSTFWIDFLGAEVRYRGKYRTRCIEYGEGSPLMLLHGNGGHAEHYARNLKRLGSAHRAIAIDLIWHGLSGKPPFTTNMVPEYAKQIIDLMDELGLEKASFEGSSLGGWISMWMGVHFPERVDKLVLTVPAGIRYDENVVKVDHVGGTATLRERSQAAIADPNRETIRKRLAWLMADPDRITEELIDVRHAYYNDPETQAALTNVFNNINGARVAAGINEADLAKITAPTLALWTDKNPGAGPEAGERVARLIPGAQYYCIKDSAHWPQWEHPEEHDRVVLAFLAGQRVDQRTTAS